MAIASALSVLLASGGGRGCRHGARAAAARLRPAFSAAAAGGPALRSALPRGGVRPGPAPAPRPALAPPLHPPRPCFSSTARLEAADGGGVGKRGRWDSLDGTAVRSLLVVGDGDLSYSASIATELAGLGVALTASVLEGREDHHATYRGSVENCRTIEEGGGGGLHEVRFGIDATDLPAHFPPSPGGPATAEFDRIQFNFPHWRGKANNRYNRELLDGFLGSASGHLTPGVGEIHVALCEGQGGGTARDKTEWRTSWKAAEYAANHGLLLLDVAPYEASYDLSSHRGMDRGFKVGKAPKMYTFGPADGKRSAPPELQMSCRHELHINLPPGHALVDEITEGEAVKELIERVVDTGIRVEVPLRRLLSTEEAQSDIPVAVFLICYSGAKRALTREMADGYRAAVEREVEKQIPLRSNRAGRLVSRTFPYPLLDNLVYFFLQKSDEREQENMAKAE